jgi:hypothetical protein
MKFNLRSLMRFSIRDLFWITVVVALVLGWWLDHRRWVPTDLTSWEVDKLESRNKLLEREILRIDRQLSDHGLQLEQKYSWGLGGRKTAYIEVVPLSDSQTPDTNPPKN